MKREGRNTACQLIFAWSLQSSNNKYLFMRWHYTLQANISGHAVESQGLNQFRAKSRAQKVKSLYICICLNKYIALHIFFYLCIYQSTIHIEKEREREREREKNVPVNCLYLRSHWLKRNPIQLAIKSRKSETR